MDWKILINIFFINEKYSPNFIFLKFSNIYKTKLTWFLFLFMNMYNFSETNIKVYVYLKDFLIFDKKLYFKIYRLYLGSSYIYILWDYIYIKSFNNPKDL